MVIDQPLGTAQWTAVETVWTFYPDLTVEPLGEDRFLLRGGEGNAMTVSVASGDSAQARIGVHRGSKSPFAGWVATERGMNPAPALRVLAGATGWTITVFDATVHEDEVRVQWVDAEHWQVEGRGWVVRRAGAQLGASAADQQDTLPVVAAPDTSEARTAIASDLAAAIAAYPKYRDLDSYRLRVAAGLLVIWLLQMIVYLGLRRLLLRRECGTAMNLALVLPWGAVATWLGAIYFAG